ncbi:MAG: peptidylprolyl isomerase [Pseudomonadota bacterium]
MMKSRLLTAASALTLSFCAFAQEATEAPPVAVEPDQVLLEVNGFQVTPRLFQAYRGMRQQPEPQDPRQAQTVILNELINIIVLSQDAEKRNLEKKEDYQALLEISRRKALAEAGIDEIVANFEVTDEAIKATYEAEYATPTKEFKARHILVKEEDEAKELIAKLDKGGDFAELAKEHSTGPTGARGGDLGWFDASSMVAPFAEALQAMKKGDYSKEPVQTQFGWHVIMLEDTREQAPPKLEDVRPALVAQLRQKAAADYVAELNKSADVKINKPEGS